MIRRREFITLLGGAAAWPLAARAQRGAIPVIGYLGTESPPLFSRQLRAFHASLHAAGEMPGDDRLGFGKPFGICKRHMQEA